MPSGFNPLSGFLAPPPKKKVTKKTEPSLVKAVRGVGRTTKAAAPAVTRTVTRTVRSEVRQARRPVMGPAVPRNVAALNRANAELDRINAELSADLPQRIKEKKDQLRLQTAGLSPLLGAGNLTDGDGKSPGGLLRNFARGGLDMLLSVPAQMQLGAEVAIAGADLLRLPVYGPAAEQSRRHVAAAGRGIADDYKRRYTPLVQGQWGTFANQLYNEPLDYLLDAAGAKGAVGRIPSAAQRSVRAVAPDSAAGLRASRALSILPADERLAFSKVTGRNILEGPGGRYRPPREIQTTLARAEEGGTPGGVRNVLVERPAYSSDITARARQKAADRLRSTVVPRVERMAERRQVAAAPVGERAAGPLARASGRVTRPFTAQSKMDRSDKRATRELIDISDALAEVATARSMAEAKTGRRRSAIARLKSRTPPGSPPRGISVEEAAWALHTKDMLGEVYRGTRQRGGLTAEALRDDYVSGSRGRQVERINQARAKGDPPPRFENSRAQLDVIAQIPRELLDLTDMSIPAVRRVAAAVKEARALNKDAQARSVDAKVITAETVTRTATRDSAIGIAGQKWGGDAIRKVTVKARRKTLIIKKRIAVAQAAGNAAEVKRLKGELANHTKATKGRVAAVRKDSTLVTPQIKKSREKLAVADAVLKAEQGKVATRKTIDRVYRAGEGAGKGKARLSGAAQIPTSPRRRPQILSPRDTRGGVPPKTKRVKSPGEPRPRGITPGQGKQYGAILKGQGERYKVRLKTEGASGRRISAATRSRDDYAKQVAKLERDALGFTSPRRPELVGTRGVYTPDKVIDERAGTTGARTGGRMTGPDQARRSEGRLKSVANITMSPHLLVHQHARAMQNWTGRISRPALNELLNMAAYRDPVTNKWLTADRMTMLSASDSQRVRLVHVGNLEKAIAKLDELPEGKWLPEDAARELFVKKLPDGAKASDYVAISKAAADVWTESMMKLKYYDKGLTYWKGGLLALSPRWYVNNMFGMGLQYIILAGPNLTSIVRGNRPALRKAMEERSPSTIRDTFVDDLTGGDVPRLLAFGFKINGHMEEFWRRSAYMSSAKRAIRDEGGRFRKMSEADMVAAINNMPEAMARKITRDVEFFMGDYRKFNKFERDWAKRIFPFYSWLRVIARLTFVMPFRHPVRVAALNILGEAAKAGINPDDSWLEYYERGALQIGGMAVPTWGLNPFQTLAPALAALGEKNRVGATAEEAVGWVMPIIQLAYAQASGTNNFGQGIVAPPGTAKYGQDPTSFNEVTLRPSRQRLRIPFGDAIVRAAIPAQISVLERVWAGGRRPFDTVSPLDLATDFFNRKAGKPRNESLYFEESERQGRKQSSINIYTAPFGIPTYDQNDAMLRKEGEALMRAFIRDAKKLERKRERNNP